MVTYPELKDLLRFMEENLLYKFHLLTHFYHYKQEGQKAGEISFSFEDNQQKKVRSCVLCLFHKVFIPLLWGNLPPLFPESSGNWRNA